ncbi:MAG: NAD-dependent epimerase/dehydratase family protein [Promethearchaeota archaeon]
MRILVTGATGFIGRQLVRKLIEDQHEVSALVRKTSDVHELPKTLRLIDGDMLDTSSLEEAVQNIDVVIHLAAYFDFYPKDKKLLYRINVEGTRNLVNACIQASVSRLIYISTTEVIGPVENPPGDENSPLRPQFDYSKSKVEAEEIVRASSLETGLDHVILRPTGVIGEGELYTVFETVQAINEGQIPMTPGDGEKILMYIYMEDVISGIITSIKSAKAKNQTIILCPDKGMTYNELFEFLGNELGVAPPKRKVPTALAKLGIGILSPFKNRQKTTFLWHMKTVQSMDENRAFSNAKAKKLLQWTPTTSMQEALKESIAWYYKHGYLEDKHEEL